MKIKTYIYLLIVLLVYFVVFYLQPQICFAQSFEQKPPNKSFKDKSNQVQAKSFEQSIKDRINKLNQTETDLKTKLDYLEKSLKNIEKNINEDKLKNTPHENRSTLAFIVSVLGFTTIAICLFLFAIKLYPQLEDYVIQIKLNSDQLELVKKEIVDLNSQINSQKKTDIDLKNQINSQKSQNSKLIQEQVQTHLNGYLSALHKEYVDINIKLESALALKPLSISEYKSKINHVAFAKLDDVRGGALVEDSNGLFYIGRARNTNSLVAIPNRERVQSSYQFDLLEKFYSCTSQTKSGDILIIKPAIVTTTPGVQEWWLEEKGVLEII